MADNDIEISIFLFVVTLFEDHGLKVGRAELLSLSIQCWNKLLTDFLAFAVC